MQYTNYFCEICIMKILFITAEAEELEACRRACEDAGVNADMVWSGMGAGPTVSKLDEMLSGADEYDFVIDAGIAGSFVGAPSGSAFNVVEERNGETPEQVFTGARVLFPWLPSAKGLTFQTMTNDPVETARRTSLGADLESMEGAAFFETCIRHGVKNFAELRTISNPVGEDDRTKWDINAGLEAIHTNCLEFLKNLK